MSFFSTCGISGAVLVRLPKSGNLVLNEVAGLGVLTGLPFSWVCCVDFMATDRGAGVGSRDIGPFDETKRSWTEGVIDLGKELGANCPLWRLSERLVEDRLLWIIGTGPPNWE